MIEKEGLKTDKKEVKMRKRTMAIVMVLIFMMGSLLLAQGKTGMMCQHGKHEGMSEKETGRMMEMRKNLADELGLTEEQEKAIAKARLEFIKNTADTKTKLEIKNAELKALWMESEPNKDAILKKVKEINDLKGELALKKAELRFEIYKILTPDQRKKIGKMGLHKGKHLF